MSTRMMNNSMTATLKYATLSSKKIGVVAKLIKWKQVNEVLPYLQFLPKKSATILWKLVKAASSNAEHNLSLKSENLVVKTVEIGRWPKIKRVRPAGRSRMHGYVKHRSFVKVVLDTVNTK